MEHTWYWQKWRNADNSKIDWKRVRKNVIIGIVLGIIAYGVKISVGDASDTGIIVVSVNDFMTTIIAAFPLVVVADKIFNRKTK